MKQVCLWGTSLQKVADEAQFLSVVDAIRARFPDARLLIFSSHGEVMAHLRSNVSVIRTFCLHQVLPVFASSDLFVMVGGPFFENLWQASICLALVSFAKMLRCPVVTYGTTIFALRTRWGRWFFRSLLNSMDGISVREPIGKQRLQALGVSKKINLFADPRFLLEPTPPALVAEILRQEGVALDQPLIGVTTRHLHRHVPMWVKYSHGYSDTHMENANQVLARVIAHFSEKAQILIIPMHPHFADDETMAGQLRAAAPDASRIKMLSRRYSSPDVLGIIGRCDLLLAGRLGSAVFATVTGTPLVAISYEDRTMDYMKRIGLEQHAFDWKNLHHAAILAAIEEVFTSPQELKQKMQEQAQSLKTLAWQNAEFLYQHLNRADSAPRPGAALTPQ